MFIQLNGLKCIRLIVNPDHIRAFQEITSDSKYAEYISEGAKTMVQIDDKIVPVKNSITQIAHTLKKLGLIGGAENERQGS